MHSVIIPSSEADKLLAAASLPRYSEALHSDGILLATGAKLRVREGQYVITGYAYDGSDVAEITR